MMDFRNARYADAQGNSIDMEVNHSVYGWIPFTANPNDTEPLGKQMFDAAMADGDVAAYAPPAVTVEQVDAERSRRVLVGRSFTVDGIGDIPVKGTPEAQTSLLALKDSARDLKAANVTDAILPMQDASGAVHKLTADQMISLVDQGKQYITSVDQAAWALQAMEPIPADYAADSHWPAVS